MTQRKALNAVTVTFYAGICAPVQVETVSDYSSFIHSSLLITLFPLGTTLLGDYDGKIMPEVY